MVLYYSVHFPLILCLHIEILLIFAYFIYILPFYFILVDLFDFSNYINSPSTNTEFYFFSSNKKSFYARPLTTLAWISNYIEYGHMMNVDDVDYGHPSYTHFTTLSMMLVVGLSYTAFTMFNV